MILLILVYGYSYNTINQYSRRYSVYVNMSTVVRSIHSGVT